MQQEDA